jgi:hypothetical protein
VKPRLGDALRLRPSLAFHELPFQGIAAHGCLTFRKPRPLIAGHSCGTCSPTRQCCSVAACGFHLRLNRWTFVISCHDGWHRVLARASKAVSKTAVAVHQQRF